MRELTKEAENLANIENNLRAFVSNLIIDSNKDSLTAFCLEAKLYPSVLHKFMYKGSGLSTSTIEKIGKYALEMEKKRKKVK